MLPETYNVKQVNNNIIQCIYTFGQCLETQKFIGKLLVMRYVLGNHGVQYITGSFFTFDVHKHKHLKIYVGKHSDIQIWQSVLHV